MDLYYRLNVFPLDVPPLRERASDIPLLVGHFLRKAARKLGKGLQGVSPRTMDRLMRHPWPGNVRELENVLECAAVLAHEDIVEVDAPLAREASGFASLTGAGTLEEVERAYIISVLEKTHWSISGERGAAAILGMNPSTLRSRMQKLGIRRSVPGQ